MNAHNDNPATNEKGIALVVALLVLAVLFILVTILTFQSYSDHVIAVNEQDHLKALGFAEAGLTWAERRVKDAGDFSDMLDGPDNASASDDHLLGIRDLSLTNTSQFTSSNESTASAIVQRDFGTGNRSYEVIRIADGQNTRALVYVRIDDNFDDDPTDPSNNAPLIDTDSRIRATAIAEYPVFVDGGGNEVPNSRAARGRARRTLVLELGGSGATPAVATNGDLDVPGNMEVCGDCGSIHSNQDVDIGGGPDICQDATASGSFSNNAGDIRGTSGGGFPLIPIPVINPYDDIFVPSIDLFDHLGCGVPTAGDPGNAKYFALIVDDNKGKVFKAYWDFANDDKWTWKLIDDLSDGTNVMLDNCGRAPGDPSYNAGNQVNDGKDDEFYGFKASETELLENCSSCGNGGSDQSLCALAANDFGVNGYYEAGTLTFKSSVSGSGIPALPGSFAPDGQPDFDAAKRLKAKWDFGANTIYSPLYGAVLWVYGQAMISGNPGDSSSIDYCDSSGCSGVLPGGLWKLSIIAYADITLSGQANLGPANPQQDYPFLLVSGRDIMINGNPQEDTPACTGSACTVTTHAGITDMGGIYAAHEQIQLSGNPNVFGFMLAEDALDCSDTVDGQGRGVTTFIGDPNIYYDCQHPPNPWNTAQVEVLSWQEAE